MNTGDSDLALALAVNGSTFADHAAWAPVTHNGESDPRSIMFGRAGETSVLDTQDFVGNDLAINGDPGDDAVYTLSSPNGTIFLADTTDIVLLTENNASLVSFKVDHTPVTPKTLFVANNETVVDNVLANAQFRPDDGFTGNTTVTFAIEGPDVSESVDIAMAVAPNNSIVNTALDVVDATDGLLSLREAVMLVNDGVTADAITFDPTVFNGELQDVIGLTQGPILIDNHIVIDGDLNDDGDPDIVISGDANGNDIIDVNGITDVDASLAGPDLLSDNTRVFSSAASFFSIVHLHGLTITGGRTTGDGANKNDFSYAGGAVSILGNVYFYDSVISGNSTAGYNATGGAVYTYGVLNFKDSLVTGNSTSGAYAHGGATFARFGSTDVRDSVIASNSTGSSTANGGAIGGFSSTDIIASTIANNESGNSGGAVYSYGGLYLLSSTVSGNTAGQYGGGAYAKDAITIVNSTLSNNSSVEHGGAIYTNLTVSAANSTFTGNNTTYGYATGGAIRAFGSITLTDSIVLGNEAGAGYAHELYTVGGYTFYGNNIVGADSAAFDTTALSYVGNANPVDVFAQTTPNGSATAGVLGFNGGNVLTVALKQSLSNPAIDAAGDSLPADNFDLDNDTDSGELLPVDSRGEGFFRTLSLSSGATEGYTNSDRDLGAYEAQGALGLVVNTADDTFDLLDNYVSLREAVAHANNGTFGYDTTITFDPTVFNGQPADVIRLTGGELYITAENITIDGDLNNDGTPDVVISGDAFGNDITNAQGITNVDASLTGADRLADNSRIFNHSYTFGQLNLDGLILTGGRTTGNDERGGAVLTNGYLNLINSAVQGNSTSGDYASGGGVSAYSFYVYNSSFNGNQTSGLHASGGVLHGDGAQSDAIYGSSFTNNQTSGYGADGGAVRTSDTLRIENSTLSNNKTLGGNADGGAVYNNFSLSLVNSTVSNNSTTLDNSNGGGLASGGGIVIEQSTVSGNSTMGNFAGGGGIYSSSGSIDVVSSTVSGNSTSGYNSRGGGIFSLSNQVKLLSSTVSGNATTGDESGGGGVYAQGGYARNSTIANNSTDGDYSGGGGIRSNSTFNVHVSTITGNYTTGNYAEGGGI